MGERAVQDRMEQDRPGLPGLLLCYGCAVAGKVGTEGTLEMMHEKSLPRRLRI